MALESFNTDGVVLKVRHTGESDRIVTVLTRDFGVLSAFAKAARRPKSRLHSATQTFCYADFSFRPSGDSYVITEASVKEVFFTLNDDLQKLSLAQYFGQLAAELTTPGEFSEENLRLILNSLHFLCSGKRDIDFIKAVTELRFAANAGYAPDVSACAHCGARPGEGVFLDCAAGVVFCQTCAHPVGCIRLDSAAFRAFRHIVTADFDRIYSVSPSGSSLGELSEAAERFVLTQTERGYSSLLFYKQIQNK